MINFYDNEIKEWYNEGEVIHKMMGAGSIIYQRLTNSSTPTYYRWITLSGEYLCDGTTKREKQQKQVTHDGGHTWENVVPTTYRMGEVIAYDSEDCGYTPTPTIQYRWVDLDPSTDFFCSGTTKMYKQQKQQSEDSGATWTNVVPSEFRMGGTAQTESTDCGYIPPTPIPQYRTISGDPYCEGYDKMVDVYSQVSYDEGETWSTTATTPTLVEHNSEDCGYVEPIYQWNQLDINTDQYCDGEVTFYKEQKQVSYDGGQTWENVVPAEYRKGNFYDILSEKCGWDANVGVIKFKESAFIYNANCNSNVIPTGDIVTYQAVNTDKKTWYYTITGDTMPILNGVNSGYRIRDIYGIFIPRSVKHIPNNCFADNSGAITEKAIIGLAEGVETIGKNAFKDLIYGCHLDIPVIIPSSVTSIDDGAFEFEFNTSGSGRLQIHFKGTTPPALGNIFGAIQSYSNKVEIYVPSGCTTAYRNAFPSIYSGLTIREESSIKFTYSNSKVCGDAELRFTADYDVSGAPYNCALSSVTCVRNCNNMQTTFNASETSMGNSGDHYFDFNNASDVTSLTIHDEIVESINIYGMTKLQYLDLPSSINTIPSTVGSLVNLTTIVLRAIIPPTLNAYTDLSNKIVYVPDESVNDYKTAENWSTYASQIKPLSEKP